MIRPVRIGVIGDVHGHFVPGDAAWLDDDGLDAVLLVGDLPEGWGSAPPRCAEAIASLKTPAWWIPGNHDGVGMSQLVAEVTGPQVARDAFAAGMWGRVQAVARALGPVAMLAYEAIEVEGAWIIAGRPFSMGGPSLAFTAALRERWGIGSLEESTAALCDLVDTVPPDAPLVWLVHNGPAGLGGARDDPFGRDFMAPAVDWGDPDLAIAWARSRNGKRPVVVVAGHMHHRLRGGGQRKTVWCQGDAAVVNTARVPRIDRDGTRHHVELRVDGERIVVCAVAVSRAGAARTPTAVCGVVT